VKILNDRDGWGWRLPPLAGAFTTIVICLAFLLAGCQRKGDPVPNPSFDLSGYRKHVAQVCGFPESTVYATQRYADSVVFQYHDAQGRSHSAQEAFQGGAVTCG
jgi:hypothetical protein